MPRNRTQNTDFVEAVDLFCGAGGLSYGLRQSGIRVVAGFDLDPACEYPYEKNNKARFVKADIASLNGADISRMYTPGSIRILAGCAPCQPFSTYRQGKADTTDKRWNLLLEFARLIEESEPDIVTMENVPLLVKQEIFRRFRKALGQLGYETKFQIVNCADYGVPQLRRRLVLLASKFGPIDLIAPTHIPALYVNVAEAIGNLPPIKAGEIDANDPFHQASVLSATNLERIKASRPGGTWKDWEKDLVAICHRKHTGHTYSGVYGRMMWDEPSPTITTQFFGFGNGRFGHPEQDRGLSLREGAILQSFPREYVFIKKDVPIHRKTIGRLIGNAVPVKLAKAIGISIRKHLATNRNKTKRQRTYIFENKEFLAG
jgi:DNA (cytosine-5)-methyltransferase 1